MAVRKNTSLPNDDYVVDKPVEYTDARVRPDCAEFWEGHYVEINGERYIKQETADRIIMENHDLRETLYMQEGTLQQAAYDNFARYTTLDMYRVKSTISNICKISIGFTEKEVYTIIYSYMTSNYRINFSECPQSKSKIQWLWENGWLPTVAVLANTLQGWFVHFDSLNRTAFAEFVKEARKTVNAKKQPRTNVAKSPSPF